MGDYGACVETDEDENGYVLVRHSAFTDPGDPYLAFTREEWDAFLAAVRADGLRLVAKSVPEWTPEGGLTADDVRAYLLQCAQILDHAAGRHVAEDLRALTCYGKRYATVPTHIAQATAEAHILACPEGAMEWATDVKWHRTDDGTLVSAACGEWLNHWIEEV